MAYSSWKGRILFLDDIIINEPYRNKGIGTLLMQELFAICKQQNIKQMRWQVFDWNEPAIQFYEKLGAIVDKDWYTCKMNF
jgi:GNAT superfamily N-acetyltransferase